MDKKTTRKNARHKGRRIAKRLTRNILDRTYDITAISFVILGSLGRATLKTFLKPSYYSDDLFNVFGEVGSFKYKILEERRIKQTLFRLQEYGLVEKKKEMYLLTLKGKYLKNKILEYDKIIREKWDGKYRLVIFDIPEVDKKHRNWLRQELYFLGYIKLQNSVFISKYSLTETIIREIKERGIDKGVNYLLVESVYDLNKEKINKYNK